MIGKAREPSRAAKASVMGAGIDPRLQALPQGGQMFRLTPCLEDRVRYIRMRLWSEE